MRAFGDCFLRVYCGPYDMSEIYDRFYSYVMNYFAPSYLEGVKVVLTGKPDYYKLSNENRRKFFTHLHQKVENIILFLHPMAPNATLMMAERIAPLSCPRFRGWCLSTAQAKSWMPSFG